MTTQVIPTSGLSQLYHRYSPANAGWAGDLQATSPSTVCLMFSTTFVLVSTHFTDREKRLSLGFQGPKVTVSYGERLCCGNFPQTSLGNHGEPPRTSV